MSALLDILTRFPNCRVTVRNSPVRRKPYEGELRVLARKGRQIRMQRVSRYPNGQIQGYCVRNGRPLYDWVSESSLTADQRDLYRRIRQDKGDPL